MLAPLDPADDLVEIWTTDAAATKRKRTDRSVSA